MGLLEEPGVIARGPGEGPPHPTEELRLRQLGAQRGHVHCHIWALGPVAGEVQQLGGQVFACARLALQQHRQVGGAEAADLFPQAPHRGRHTHQAGQGA